MKKIALLYTLFINVFSLFSQENTLGLKEILDLTLKNDSRIKLFTEYAHEQYYAYRSVKGGNLPLLQSSIGYSPSAWFVSSANTGNYAYEYVNHTIPQSLSVSQILPTGGTLHITASNTTDFISATEFNSDITPGTMTRITSYEIRQNPSLSISYTQPVFINGKIIDTEVLPATIRQSELSYLKSLLRLQDTKNSSILHALTLFYHILELKMSLSLQQGWLEWELKKLEHLKRSLELNLVTDTEVWEMRIDIGDREEIILNIEHSCEQAEKSLAYIFGLENIVQIEYSEKVPSLAFTLLKEDLLKKALALNPVILEYIYTCESTQISSMLFESDYLNNPPHLSLSFSLTPHYPDSRGNADDFISSFTDLLSDGAGTNWNLSFILTLPLYDGEKKKYGRNAVKAAERATEEQLAYQIKNTKILCETTLLNSIQLQQKIELTRDHVELNRKKVGIEKTRLEHKKATDIDVEEAELWLMEQENKLWRLQVDYFLEVCKLYTFTGVSLDEKLDDLIIR
ncbi:MAG: TolC family protein [Spirochaetales bacterium]|nr:TolC family protein [Spirochaetales bacterium]